MDGWIDLLNTVFARNYECPWNGSMLLLLWDRGLSVTFCITQHLLRLSLACVMGANTKWLREAKGGRWVCQESSWEEISAERKDGGRETQASSPVFWRSKISLSGFVKLITLQSSVEWVYCFPRSVLWHLSLMGLTCCGCLENRVPWNLV